MSARPTPFAPTAADLADAFVDEVAALPPAAFVARFHAPRPVAVPALPVAHPDQIANADAVLAGRFSAVGETFDLGRSFSWKRNPSRDKEWLIAHHKFYFALDLAQAWRATGRAAYLARWHELLESWIDEMGSGFIAASDAQVEARRLEHWVMSFLAIQAGGGIVRLPAAFLRRFLARIAAETQYVASNLRPARNHRTFQLYAIFLVGLVFPELRARDRLLALGREGLVANLAHDFGEDGVHVELSSHYHQITLEVALAFADLALRNGMALPASLMERLHRAAEFSMWLTWPDGTLPLVNDADDGDHRPMLALAARLFRDARLAWAASGGEQGIAPPGASRGFGRSGYFVLGDGWGSGAESFRHRQHVLYDCGPLGEGSHSQYDLFNFTYFAGGRPLVVDPGRYTYCADPGTDGIDWRQVFKSTASHNTVTIDGRDQTRYLSKSKTPPPGIERYDRGRHPVKHGPDVEILDPSSHLGTHTDWICGTALSHEYTPRHTRLFAFVCRQYLAILDRIECDDGMPHLADLRFHFAAEANGRVALETADGRLRAQGPGWQLACIGGDAIDARIEPGWVSTRYGVKEAAPVLSVRQRSAASMAFATVLASAAAGIRIEQVAWSRSRCARTLALDIDLVLADGTARRDHVLLRRPDAERYEEDGLRYGGKVLIWREGADGALDHLCASHPAALDIAGTRRTGLDWKGEKEWSAMTTR